MRSPDHVAPQGRQQVAQRLASHALALVSMGLASSAECQPWYSPLVITGPEGSGKSRILAEWFGRQSGPDGLMTLWDGRCLGRELVAALGSGGLERLHQRFVGNRLIVIDGIERMVAWDAQRTLSHLFDAATAGGTFFVVSLRAHPIACRGLEPSLASRLSGGLVVSMPSVGRVRGDAAAATTLDGPSPSLRRIKNATARRYGLTAADLVGPSRRREVAHARSLAMYLSRTLTAASLQTIGAAFGGRDHTTVLHGIRVTEVRRTADDGVAADIEHLALALRGRTAGSL